MADAFIVRRGGCTRYALLTVTTDETSLQSELVTVEGSKDGKTESQTKRMVGGSAKFRLKLLTDYSITCGEATSKVEVTSYADYDAIVMLWDGTLLPANDDNKKLTGGFESVIIVKSGGTPSIDITDSLITLTNQIPSRHGAAISQKPVDLSGYDKLKFNFISGTGSRYSYGLTTSKVAEEIIPKAVTGFFIDNSSSGAAERVIDLSGLDKSKSYYVCIVGNHNNSTGTSAICDKIWLARE